MSLELDEHRHLLSDQRRLEAFSRAIAKVVKPGDVVLDLGSGTGILGMMACRAGAARVYAVDAGAMVQLGREIARTNGFADRIIGVKGLSTRIDLPEKVDVVVADQIGNFGMNAGVVEYFRDARRRLLKPGGRMLPESIGLYAAPVSFDAMWKRVAFWNSRPAGFDFSPAFQIAANTGYPTELKSERLLAQGARLITINLNSTDRRRFEGKAGLIAGSAGVMHGLAGWFSAKLAPGVELTNAPCATLSIDRRRVYLPIETPVPVKKGDRVEIRLRVQTDTIAVTWETRVERSRDTIGEFRQSTLRGMLLSGEDLAAADPDFVPKLSRWGLARRSVAQLCDGKRKLRAIERELMRRHPDLFSDLDEAAAFVAEVVNPYAVLTKS